MPLNPIKLLLNSKNPPFLVSGVLGSEAHTDARRLRCYPAIRTSSKCCGRALDRFCIAKHGDCTQKKWKLKLWNPDFIKNLGIYIITTKSSRKRLNIGNKRRRELGKPRRRNDLVSLGPSGINLGKKLTGSWKIGTPALFCFPFSHMESEMMDVVGNWGKLKGLNPRPSGEQKKHFSVAHLLKALHMKKHTDTNTLKLPFVGDTDHKFVIGSVNISRDTHMGLTSVSWLPKRTKKHRFHTYMCG